MSEMPTTRALAAARWIWVDKGYEDPVNQYVQFHRSVPVAAVPEQAAAAITADQEYQLFINGRYVTRGPARGYQSHWPVDVIDLAPWFRAGENVVAVIAHNPGVGTFKYRSAGHAGFLFAIELDDQAVVTDRNWRCRRDPARLRHTPKLSKQLGFQEQIDLRADDRSWMTCATDELDADWIKPTAKHYGSAPWHTTEARGLPQLTRDVTPYAKTVGAATFPIAASVSARFPHTAPMRPTALHRDKLTAAHWSKAPPTSVTNGATTLDTSTVEDQQAHAVTLDLGRASVGELLIEVEHAAGGEVLDVLFAETIDPAGAPHLPDPNAPNRIDMATRIILSAQHGRHEAFQVIGHRYATLVLTGPSPALRMHIAHRETRYPLETTGTFACDATRLQQVYDISVYTQRNCMLDAYVDTPWREQAQWWGDARVQAWNTFYLANDPRLLRRGLRQVGDPEQAVPNGLTYGHAPTIAHDCILPDFACIWLLTLWDDYFQTGDPHMFAELWPRVDRVVQYFESFGIADGQLVGADPRYWLFLDWTPGLPRTGQPALLNMLLLEALESVAALVDLANPGGTSDRIKPLAATLRKTIDARLWDGQLGRYRDGIAPDGEPFSSTCLHTQVQAVLCGLRPEMHAALGRDVISPFLRGATQEPAEPTPYWMTYIYEAARRLGLAHEVIEHLANAWAPMIEHGGTWERFVAPGGGSSGSHAWAAHPTHHLPRMIGGIVNEAPGWRRIGFQPLVTCPLCTSAQTTVPTAHGLIQAEWSRAGQVATVELHLPEGVEADIRLPGVKESISAGSRRWRVEIHE